MTKHKRENEYPLASKLGKLLPVLGALLDHEGFNPHLQPSQETVSLFRNFWFHCVLFGFVTESMWIREWHPAMLLISKKTPVLVIESNTTYLESDLEHNSVLRNSSAADHGLSPMRQKLTNFLPNLSYDIKNFSFAQIVFALSVYHVEMMRSRVGDCSYILRYFMNDGVSSSSLGNCLETIAERVTQAFIKDCSIKAMNQNLDVNLRTQTSTLLELCCHKRKKVHQLAVKTVDRIVSSFPQVFTDTSLVTLLLELVQLAWLSCEAEYRDEVINNNNNNLYILLMTILNSILLYSNLLRIVLVSPLNWVTLMPTVRNFVPRYLKALASGSILLLHVLPSKSLVCCRNTWQSLTDTLQVVCLMLLIWAVLWPLKLVKPLQRMNYLLVR
jgi:hypothetical protein